MIPYRQKGLGSANRDLPARGGHADCQGISLHAKPNQEIGIITSMKRLVQHILWLLSRSYRHRLIVRRVS